MRVLVSWGSERGGTEGIARIIAETLRRDGIDVEARAADDVADLDGFDAVIVGGALYANRWHRSARRLVRRHVRALRQVPVWFFSSGPLDTSADQAEIAPVGQVAALMARVGARGHRTFGGALAPDARGFPARAMARTHSGDWRNPTRIRAWAEELAGMLPSARPGHGVDAPARSLGRLTAHVLLASVLVAVARLAMSPLPGSVLALALHTIAAAAIGVAIGRAYFLPLGARDPLPTSITFGFASAGLDLLVLGVLLGGGVTLVEVMALSLSVAATFVAVWLTGALVSTLPWPKPPAPSHGT
jgi:menaquinone-dependent protoporphyrinogen oxidase